MRCILAALSCAAASLAYAQGQGAASCQSLETPAITLPAADKIASRVSGVAPLAVFFDATGTTAGATERPFHDLEYRWDFGDPGSGSWAATPGMPNLGRNSATGGVAAHVYERPGTYDVCLTVFDGKSSARTGLRVTVDDPEVEFAGDKTACFSNSADFSGCPADARQVTTADFGAVLKAGALGNPSRRLLLRRGDVFTAAALAELTRAGPGILGAFGPQKAARPVVRSGANGRMLHLSSGRTPFFKDWRIMDLEFDGQSGSNAVAIYAAGGADQVTLLRLNIHHVRSGLEFSSFLLELYNVGRATGAKGHRLWDQLAVVDSTISHAASTANFISARRFAFLGNKASTIVRSAGAPGHLLRTPYVAKAVIGHNNFSGSAPSKHALTVRAPCRRGSGCTRLSVDFNGGSGYSEKVMIADNQFEGAGSDYTVTVQPTDPNSDERVRDVIFERNWFTSGPGTQFGLMIEASEITVRNNICITSGGQGKSCFLVRLASRMEGFPAPDNNRFYNNSIYSAAGGRTFAGIVVQPGATNTTIQNNLAYAPNDAAHKMIHGASTGLAAANNSSDAQVGATAPGWARAAPSAPADFKLEAGSYALDKGAAVPVFSDFFRERRPRSGAPDLGATER